MNLDWCEVCIDRLKALFSLYPPGYMILLHGGTTTLLVASEAENDIQSPSLCLKCITGSV